MLCQGIELPCRCRIKKIVGIPLISRSAFLALAIVLHAK